MIKLSQKRIREWNENEISNISPTSCSPRKIVNLDYSPLKKIKNIHDNNFLGNNSEQIKLITKNDSPFNSSNDMDTISTATNNHNNVEPEQLLKYISKKNKKKVQDLSSQEPLFTYSQVKEIVNRIVSEREAQLRAEYDMILQQRLQEQFKNFTKFNEDYISKQFKQTDFSYLS
jgi:hypothetical protein